MVTVIQGSLAGAGRRFAIAVARFNQVVTERLLQGANDALNKQGVQESDIVVAWVPGAVELGPTCRWLAATGKFDAVIALGAVVRGGTDHYRHVSEQAARGIVDAGMQTSVPAIFGVLTCDTIEQALERAGGAAGNKGADAALAAIEMASVRAMIGGS
jgi:6,7-dimethyl-8-ribityllumazine synthase